MYHLVKENLGNMMPRMSIKYGSSQRYTNHYLCVTSTQVLFDTNFGGRHIIRIIGHKSESSVKGYARTLSFSRKTNISHTVSKTLENNIDKENTDSSKRSFKGQSSQAPVTRIRFQIVPFSFRCVFKSIHFGLRIQMFAFS